MKPLHLILTICLLLTHTTEAQVYYKANTLTTTNGLSDKRVTCFHQDKKGFMWIGTRNGLNRYDGHSFKIFRPATGNSISGEVINDIAEDSRGRIWVATMEGLNIYDPATGRWNLMQPDDANPQNSLPNYIIWDIFIDEDDIVWIVPDNSALVSYNIRSSK
ncbi:MAG: hypothetical protein JNM88_19825, partial [Chitinophagaceae bacterium]|nr:hypothetical protein [Chitinophagaceae bacterium]